MTPQKPPLKHPPRVPIWKWIAKFPELTRNPIGFIEERFRENGKIFIGQLGFDKVYLLQDPAHIQHVLQKNSRNYEKSHIIDSLARYVGRGLLTSSGDYWLKQRRLIQPGFHRKKLEGLANIMTTEIDDFLVGFEKRNGDGKPFDVSKEMMHLTFNVVSRSLFHTGMSEEELQRVDHIITVLQHQIIQLIRKPFFKPWYYLNGTMKKCDKLTEEIDELIFRVIQERQESGESHDDLLDMLLSTRYEDTGEGMTPQQLRDESLILFLAGHETSANALSWTWYLLAQHPEIRQKVLDEVNQVVGSEEAGFEHVHELKYTLQVIEESMRLFPPAWIIDRFSLQEDEVGEWHIPAKTMVNIFVWGVHHDPDLWREPDKFDPDRFSPENSEGRHPFAYCPFGGGPKICIGKSFALMEMQLIVARLIRRFNFQLVENQKIETEPLVTLRPKNGIKMRLG